MFKRLIAALLSLALCLSSLASSLAEEPVYIYPEIRITLLPDDRAALEMSFRQWAQAVIFDYYSGVYSASGSSRATHMGQPFGEYYRLAYSKQAFDKENIGNKSILYNTHRDADLTQNESVLTWVLIESLQESVQLNRKVILERYNATPRSMRKYLVLNIETGGLTVSEILQATEDVESTRAQSAWINLANDTVLLAMDCLTAWELAGTSSSQDKTLSDVISTAFDATDAFVESLMDSAVKNAQLRAQDTVREYLICQLASQLYNTHLETLLFLRAAYASGSIETYGQQAQIEAFVDMLDPVKHPEIATMLSEQAATQINMYSVADDYITSTGLAFVETIDFRTAISLALMDAAAEGIKGALEMLEDTLKEKFKGKNFSIKKVDIISVNDFIEIVFGTLSDTVNETVDKTIEEVYQDYMSGKSLEWDNPGDLIWDNVKSALTGTMIWQNILDNLSKVVMQNLAGKAEAWGGKKLSGTGWPDWAERLFNFVLEGGAATFDSSDGLVKLGEIICGQSRPITGEDIGAFLSLLGEQLSQSFLQSTESWSSIGSLYGKAVSTYKKSERKMNRLLSIKEEDRTPRNNKQISRTKTAMDEAEQAIETYGGQIAFDMICNVIDSTWEVGTSLREAVDSTMADLSNEGSLSLLASSVFKAKQLSDGVRTDVIGKIQSYCHSMSVSSLSELDFVLDPSRMPLEDLVAIISLIHTQLKYDIVGTSMYYNISFKAWHGGEYLGTVLSRNGDGSVASYHHVGEVQFWNYLRTNHVNVHHEKGVMLVGFAENYYREVQSLIDTHYAAKWDPAWGIFWQPGEGGM